VTSKVPLKTDSDHVQDVIRDEEKDEIKDEVFELNMEESQAMKTFTEESEMVHMLIMLKVLLMFIHSN